MMSLYLSAFFQNTGLTIVLIGFVFYLIHHFHATLFQLGALTGMGALVFMGGAASSRFFARHFSPKQLTLFGTTLFIMSSLSYPFLPTFASVFWAYSFASFAMSLFWPSLENWISLESPTGSLKRSVVRFNLSWSPGQIIAPFLAGFLFERGALLPIWFGTFLTFPVFFLLSRFPMRTLEKGTPSQKSHHAAPSRFLVACWLSNLAAWFAAAIFRSLFPKYGLVLGLSPSTIGAYLLLIGVGQVLFFFFLGRFEGWEHSPRFLFFWEGVAVFALLSIALTHQPVLWVFSFFLFGCFAGTAYSASLFMSLKERGPHGGGSSFHESLIGLGICLGPIVGGGIGQRFGAHAPYLASAAMLFIVLLAQYLLLRNSTIVIPGE